MYNYTTMIYIYIYNGILVATENIRNTNNITVSVSLQGLSVCFSCVSCLVLSDLVLSVIVVSAGGYGRMYSNRLSGGLYSKLHDSRLP